MPDLAVVGQHEIVAAFCYAFEVAERESKFDVAAVGGDAVDGAAFGCAEGAAAGKAIGVNRPYLVGLAFWVVHSFFISDLRLRFWIDFLRAWNSARLCTMVGSDRVKVGCADSRDGARK